MRLLILSNLFPPAFIGGYELAAHDVAVAMAGRGHEVLVLSSPALDGQPDPKLPFALQRTLNCVTHSQEPAVPEEAWRRGIGISVRNISAVADALVAFRPDAVLGFNTAGLGVLGLLRLLSLAAPAPVMFMMDDPFAGAPHDAAQIVRLRRMLGCVGGLEGMPTIVCSALLARELSGILGPFSPCAVVPAWAAPSNAGLAAPEPNGCVRFVFASRIAVHKGMLVAVEAAARVLATHGQCFSVDVWGGGAVAQMMLAAHAAGLGEVMRYRGVAEKSALQECLAGYDALLMPTWEREPSAFIVSEAAVAGCIPIVTASIGGAEYLLDRQHCLKIRRDPCDLAEAMASLIQMPPAARQAFRHRAQRQARLVFAPGFCMDRVEAVLRDTMARRPAPLLSPGEAALALTALAHLWRERVKGGIDAVGRVG